MFALISPEKTQISPGAMMRIPATWDEYQTLCQQRGDRTIPRLKYLIYTQKQLLIYQLQQNFYLLQSHSLYFPGVDLAEIVQQCIETAYNRNTSAAIKELKRFLS